jgi:hypothetical protein
MNDAIALLAMSQIICLGAIAYLYAQVQSLRRRPARQTVPALSGVAAEGPIASTNRNQFERPPRRAKPPAAPAFDAASLLDHIRNSDMDVPALARKLRRSEDEVRLLLRRQGIKR